MSSELPSAEDPKKEKPNPPQENPFELVDYEDAQVPRVLLGADRGNHLTAYLKGWRDQIRYGKEIVDTVERQVRRDKDTKFDPQKKKEYEWEKAGRAKAWILHGRGGTRDHSEQDTYELMSRMRSNTFTIPNKAFPFASEDSHADRMANWVPNEPKSSDDPIESEDF